MTVMVWNGATLPSAGNAVRECVSGLIYPAHARTRKPIATVNVNAADDPPASVYFTVTGTSAEGGDDGEAGRGNRANGLITPYRPMTMELVAGKNPVNHVGKLYNLVAGLIAADLVSEVEGILRPMFAGQRDRPANRAATGHRSADPAGAR